MFPKVARLLINGVASSVPSLQVACLRHLLELLGNTSHIIIKMSHIHFQQCFERIETCVEHIALFVAYWLVLVSML